MRVNDRARSLLRDRRGLGVAEYALMLFLVIVIAAVGFRFIGKSVKHAGNKTEEQFQGSGSGGSGQQANAAGAGSAGGKGGGNTAAGGTAGGGGGGGTGGTSGAGGGSGGGGGGGSAGGGGKATPDNASSGSGGAAEEEEEQKTPLWKIIGGVFVMLFAVGGYFAFRKQSKGG